MYDGSSERACEFIAAFSAAGVLALLLLGAHRQCHTIGVCSRQWQRANLPNRSSTTHVFLIRLSFNFPSTTLPRRLPCSPECRTTHSSTPAKLFDDPWFSPERVQHPWKLHSSIHSWLEIPLAHLSRRQSSHISYSPRPPDCDPYPSSTFDSMTG